VAEVTTAATYESAELYRQLGKDLMSSERPNGLSKDELEQYNVLLEEQAFPFEENAIKLHEVNAARTKDGDYDEWVQKSFAALAQLNPGRYGKVELGEPLVDSLTWGRCCSSGAASTCRSGTALRVAVGHPLPRIRRSPRLRPVMRPQTRRRFRRRPRPPMPMPYGSCVPGVPATRNCRSNSSP
jgi:hypothetical protein